MLYRIGHQECWYLRELDVEPDLPVLPQAVYGSHATGLCPKELQGQVTGALANRRQCLTGCPLRTWRSCPARHSWLTILLPDTLTARQYYCQTLLLPDNITARQYYWQTLLLPDNITARKYYCQTILLPDTHHRGDRGCGGQGESLECRQVYREGSGRKQWHKTIQWKKRTTLVAISNSGPGHLQLMLL